MRTNWKGFGLGFLFAGLLGVALAANNLPAGQRAGRFAIAISGDRSVMVDTATGQAWAHQFPANHAGPSAAEFFSAKLKVPPPEDRAPLPPAPGADPSS